MKELNKWLNENPYSKSIAPEVAKLAWKAALECVRDKMLPNCHEPIDIYDFIEEELHDSC